MVHDGISDDEAVIIDQQAHEMTMQVLHQGKLMNAAVLWDQQHGTC